ncbi:MAG: hypothetical protein JKY55_14305 [Aliivibrio sp.]|uniref:hypothetical protein n=1 Tax=Aliivibrio sp. TaxID=1872443 RepID=UPI001A505CBB|nr:hypothetical protein [Aliivibrio sp.]
MLQTLIEQKYQEKMAWMLSHVDVQFPTPASLIGKDHYADLDAKMTDIHQIDFCLLHALSLPQFTDDIVLIDNHRMTIRLAMLLAEKWPEHKESVFEFLTQIILDDDYQLYLALEQNQPTACAMVTKVTDNTVLISDIAFASDMKTINKQSFICDLTKLVQSNSQMNSAAIVTSNPTDVWLNELNL